MTSTERRNEMLYLLSATRNNNIKALADRFNVSSATIERDISILSMKYPIYTKQGRNGGVYVMDGFYASNTYLSMEQEKVLLNLIDRVALKEKKVLEGILFKFRMPQSEEK